MKETYLLKLHCSNCFANFEKSFDKGFEVKERGFMSDHKFIKDETGEFVECPRCGCTNICKTYSNGEKL